MKTDKNTTNVIFYIEPMEGSTKLENGNILAYFPDLKYQDAGNPMTCYSHVGQHSGCMPEYANKLTRATEPEYKDLKNELESIGYNLNILN